MNEYHALENPSLKKYMEEIKMSEEKLNELKEKVAGLQEELKELTPEEIEKVFGGDVKMKQGTNTASRSPRFNNITS